MQNAPRTVNVSFIVAIVLALTTLGALAAFIWAYLEKDHYQYDTELIVAEAVTEAKQAQYTTDEGIFFEEAKKPNTIFAGPSDFGSVGFNYPKTWSVYNDKNDSSNYSAYFYPIMVPPIKAETAYALRVSVESKAYDDAIKSYKSQTDKGELSATPITTTLGGYNGMRFDGQIAKGLSGSIVVFKVRDKTLTVRVDSQDYMGDFNNTILPSLTFVP
ncbi:hypothetical protein FACS189431_8700 [Alphaproteobacteria bacterium]|nr:hypothetical protein FACS189431_8700 [Alphaproteobacteria bacterium]